MSVQTATIIDGATASFTGGTSRTYTPSAQKVNNGINIVDTSAADYRIRTNLSLRGVEPVTDKSGVVVTKGQRVVTVTSPKILASGSIDFPCVEVKFKFHPEQSAAEKLELRKKAAQALLDTDFDNFWEYGSIL